MKSKKMLISLSAALAITAFSFTAFAAAGSGTDANNAAVSSAAASDQGSQFCGGYGRAGGDKDGVYNCWD
ncbi:hypothetical protein [Pectinatus haikarae]|uniref:Membrane protein n=1 Tax=Pectinatus haikarae TaxID=349096 RepID=A0ABT9YAM2_9FIRM|nr:hypothetical protein [Pectinatus haikarae]MDQ0204540.1 putative membrane protein [Pectinatus haikarae]